MTRWPRPEPSTSATGVFRSADWIETKNSFGYEVNGQQYYCTYNNGGWGIQVNTGNGVTQWTFVRWISK